MEKEFEELYKDISEDAIQRTDGKQTKRGYNTVGYGYQYCVDRLNETFGFDWGFNYNIIDHVKGNYNSGTPFHEVTVNIDIWVKNKENPRSCIGSHTAINFGDAVKGAITNGFKKTASFWGVGAKAYRGEIDPDNKPLPDSDENKINNQNVKELPNCPECGQRLYKQNDGTGYFCWKNKGGCGNNFDNDLNKKKIDSSGCTLSGMVINNNKKKGDIKKLFDKLNDPKLTFSELYDLKQMIGEREWTEEEKKDIDFTIGELEKTLNPFNDKDVPL